MAKIISYALIGDFYPLLQSGIPVIKECVLLPLAPTHPLILLNVVPYILSYVYVVSSILM